MPVEQHEGDPHAVSLWLEVVQPFPRRHVLAAAMARTVSEIGLRALTVGYVVEPWINHVYPVLTVGEGSPKGIELTEPAFTLPPALSGGAPKVQRGAVSIGSREDEIWGIWFESPRPVARARLAPLLLWMAALAVPVMLEEPLDVPGDDEVAAALLSAREFIAQGMQTPTDVLHIIRRELRDDFPLLAEAFGRHDRLPAALQDLGDRLTSQADYERAGIAYRLGYSASVLLHAPTEAAWLAQRLGRTARLRSQWADAEEWYMQSASLAENVDRLDLTAIALDGHGNVALMRGAYPEARRRFGEAHTVAEASGDRLAQARTAHSLCIVTKQAGDHVASLRHGTRAARLHTGEERLWAFLAMFEPLVALGEPELAERVADLMVAAEDRERRAIGGAAKARVLAGRDPAALEPMIGAPLDGLSAYARAEILYHRARALEEVGRGEEAIRTARGALAVATEVGVGLYIHQADELVRRLESGVPAPAATQGLDADTRAKLAALL